MLPRSLALIALSALCAAAQTVDRTKAPQTPPIPGYKLPATYQTKLPNGLGVVLIEDARFPLVTGRLNFQAGSKFDPAETPGLSEAVAALLVEGTKTRTSRQISEETDGFGGALGGTTGPDALTVSGNALSDDLAKMLGLMADVTINATFPPAEVTLYKQNRIENLHAQRADPSFLADEKMSQVLYGSSPYAHVAPTEPAIGRLDTKTLAAFRDTYLIPDNATLILIGKLPARETVMRTITAAFGAWPRKPAPAAVKMNLPAPRRQIVLVDRPGSVQADIHIGNLAPTRLTPDFFPLSLGTNILGGGTNSRLFKDIRERDGYAYDAHTEYVTNRGAATFAAVTEVRNEVIEPALKGVIAEMDQMASTPVPAKELTDIKNFMAGLYLLRLETQDGVADQLTRINTLGLPADYLETYVTHVRSVEPSQIEAEAKKYIAPGQAAIVVVGDASKIGDTLKKFGEVTITKAN